MTHFSANYVHRMKGAKTADAKQSRLHRRSRNCRLSLLNHPSIYTPFYLLTHLHSCGREVACFVDSDDQGKHTQRLCHVRWLLLCCAEGAWACRRTGKERGHLLLGWRRQSCDQHMLAQQAYTGTHIAHTTLKHSSCHTSARSIAHHTCTEHAPMAMSVSIAAPLKPANVVTGLPSLLPVETADAGSHEVVGSCWAGCLWCCSLACEGVCEDFKHLSCDRLLLCCLCSRCVGGCLWAG